MSAASFLGIATLNYLDGGVAQHQALAGVPMIGSPLIRTLATSNRGAA